MSHTEERSKGQGSDIRLLWVKWSIMGWWSVWRLIVFVWRRSSRSPASRLLFFSNTNSFSLALVSLFSTFCCRLETRLSRHSFTLLSETCFQPAVVLASLWPWSGSRRARFSGGFHSNADLSIICSELHHQDTKTKRWCVSISAFHRINDLWISPWVPVFHIWDCIVTL